MPNLPTSFRLPFHLSEDVHPEVRAALRWLHNSTKDLNDAVVAIKPQLGAAAAAPVAIAAPIAQVATAPSASIPNSIGTVNQQSGTFYPLRGTDFGALVVLGNALPVAVSLDNTLVVTPFYTVIENLGPSVATLTPATATINGVASVPIASGGLALVFFDGISWWTTTLPLFPISLANAVHKWLNSYDSTTGLFTQTQPAAADLSDTPTAGNVLRGNGTAFISAVLAAADLANGVTGTGAVVLASAPTLASNVKITGIPVFANNAAAITGGLAVGNLYRTGVDPDFIAVVH